jgi:hypothetical protein
VARAIDASVDLYAFLFQVLGGGAGVTEPLASSASVR